MSITRHHNEWLSLVPNSGPFLSLPVLAQAFPQGLDAHDPDHARRLRMAFDEWDDNQLGNRPDPSLHRAWMKFVLAETLGYDELLAEGQSIPPTLKSEVAEYGETLRPDWIVNDPATKKVRLLVQVFPRSQSLTKPVAASRWKTSPDTRMMQLLHDTGIRLGIVTNGDHWMLVNAPKNETTGYVSWYANLWLEEKETLRAFRTLLGADRLFSVPEGETLESLLNKSANDQQEVTDQLGYQVRKAVEVLIQSLDKADQEHGRKLLAGVNEKVLYESALTVMMRLVFLFCAEERELLLLGDDLYDKNYAVSTLREQLRVTADQFGEEILGLRYDAWSRLLTTFRAVYAGAKHDRLKLPAYGGSLFNPDRFPFLEGRKLGTHWKNTEATPLPISNRTVLHLLEALQVLQTKIGNTTEARKISFRALDIEQIGHVYEGLLDHTAKRATETVLGLAGTRTKEPEIALAELEKFAAKGEKELLKFVKDESGRSESAIKKGLNAEIDDQLVNRFRTVCQDSDLWKRVKPFAGLVRFDDVDYPVVITTGSVFVTAGTDRRSSGTHYTPKSLTEPIVQYTLEPLVYVGPAEGLLKDQWKLRSAKELVALKICDMACGSGAFLVQACRYMAARLLEAWDAAMRGEGLGARGEIGEPYGDAALSGVDCLAEVDGARQTLLRNHEGVSEKRTLWDDQSNSSLGSVDSSQYRRGERTGAHEGISESPEHRTGIVGGTGNTPDSEPRSRTSSESGHGELSELGGRSQPNAGRTSQITGESLVEPKMTAPSTSSPLTTSPSPLTPRITPEGEASKGKPGEMLIPDDPDERQTYALRIVAQRCLYGVDINPLAVEMAKLSLWLLTLAKDKPFEFLDHAIRCGDSLVGLHNLEQLRHYSLKPESDKAVLYGGPLDEEVAEAIQLRLQLESLPANTVEEVQHQEKLLKKANDQTAMLKCSADMLVAAEFWGESARDKAERVRHNAVRTTYYLDQCKKADEKANATVEFQSVAAKERRGQSMFHWPLEFPEVIVKRGGFDAFVGNPPFLGGRRIRSTLGESLLNWLTLSLFVESSGNADLCAFFFLRAYSLLRPSACLGLLATNTISQGDTRQTGLDSLCKQGGCIYNATRSRIWPGHAAVAVSVVHCTKQISVTPCLLDNQLVERISSYLEAASETAGTPFRLAGNRGISHIGSVVNGMGWLLQPQDALALIQQDSRNSEVLFPYLIGSDLNSTPDTSPKRWTINFFDWPIKRAQSYPVPFETVQAKVKPHRDTVRRTAYKERWWHYAERQERLYEAISELPRTLVIAQTSKTLAFCFVPTNIVFSHMTVVIASDEDAVFAILQSSIHTIWVLQYAASLKGDARYIPTDCFETFPVATLLSNLTRLGAEYDQKRTAIMLARQEGLTKTYNRFHDPKETSPDIQTLRDLHVQMDKAVAAAYDWTDLNLGHGFHETKQGTRYTISEPARREVLQRLLKLNHERYAEEVAQGLHDKKKPTTKKATPKKKTASKPANHEASLFDMEDDE